MISPEPFISVILPTYNRANLIEKSIHSVLQQTYPNFELIIIDDGSTDNTEDVVKKITDPRVKYIKYSVNKGANIARNIGIKASVGDYLAFQDSDDEWYPDKLAIHIKETLSTSDDIGVFYSGFYRISDSNKVYIPKKYINKNTSILSNLLKENFISTQSALIKKECFFVVGYFDETLPRFQDWDLFIRLSKYYKFKYINKATFNQYVTPISISTSESAKFEALEIIVNKYKQDYEKPTLAFNYFKLGVWHCANTDSTKGRPLLYKSLLLVPYNPIYFFGFSLSFLGSNFYSSCYYLYRGLKKYIK